ncbi:aldo/keto reductase [Paenibacillus nasutitermitis]|uniref:Aldo/keto reductase n=2 Tax=Paenibacillus nasutitermitis TaxID=1652958 RepID=A0A917DQ98_9BACL|nr:aldo/keto reductase [Paenibacillus nasutitermitis]
MLGTAQLGMSGYGINNNGGQVNAESLLGRCEQWGVNCYDTAYEYGDAELKLGKYFQGKKIPFIASKLKIDMDLTSEREIERQIFARTEAILTRLQLEAIPALLVHNPDMVEKYGHTISTVMRKLRTEGLIERGGISYGADPVRQYDAVSGLASDDIYEVVQIPLNLFDRRLVQCGAMQSFGAGGKIVVVRSVFLQGLFFMREDALPEKLRVDAGRLLGQLRTLAAAEDLSVAQLAVSYIRDMAGVHCLIIGAESEQQIDDNVRLINGPSLLAETRARIERLFSDVPSDVITPSVWR